MSPLGDSTFYCWILLQMCATRILSHRDIVQGYDCTYPCPTHSCNFSGDDNWLMDSAVMQEKVVVVVVSAPLLFFGMWALGTPQACELCHTVVGGVCGCYLHHAVPKRGNQVVCNHMGNGAVHDTQDLHDRWAVHLFGVDAVIGCMYCPIGACQPLQQTVVAWRPVNMCT